MLVAKSICQVKGPADMESIGDDTDSCALRDEFRGEDQVFPGVGGLVFCQDPVGGKARGFPDRSSGICFGARFIGALSAGNDEDGIRVISSIIKGCIQPESQSPAWTGGTHVGAKDDDIIKTRSRIQSGGTKNHTFHADKDQNAYCDKSKQNSPDAWRKLCKKVNME